MIDRVVLAKRRRDVRAIHARGARVDEVLDAAVTACLEEVDEPDEVARHVRVRILQ
jgi:hypothetical protein